MDKDDEKERLSEKRKRLQTLFSLLTGETQSYVLGLAEGLKAAQERAVARRPSADGELLIG